METPRERYDRARDLLARRRTDTRRDITHHVDTTAARAAHPPAPERPTTRSRRR
ncbi:hypothetical protein [Streptomyces sp. NPDC002785]|uniref:hypothetical protein n=1 Tax=Streptomyces sp. NPDC002785 TaxID=3154543 RepID=UPI00332FEBE5